MTFQGGHRHLGRDQVLVKMTPEMSRAIRRHEKNTGFDYWKTGFSGLNVISPTSLERRQYTSPKMTQININFPGFFLPNVDKPRRKDAMSVHNPLASPFPFARSKSTMTSSTVPRRRPTERPKRKTEQDLTCMQLTDSVLSYAGPRFSALSIFRHPLGTSHLKYVDSSGDDGGRTSTDDERVSSADDLQNGVRDSESDTGDSSELSSQNQEVSPKPNYRRPSPKPQKSILKNRTLVNTTEIDGNKDPFDVELPRPQAVCSYVMSPIKVSSAPRATAHSRQNSKLVLESIRPRINSGYAYSSIRRYPSAKSCSSYSDNNDSLVDILNDLNDRKRIVRFNASHQIHEYTPCKPISQSANDAI